MQASTGPPKFKFYVLTPSWLELTRALDDGPKVTVSHNQGDSFSFYGNNPGSKTPPEGPKINPELISTGAEDVAKAVAKVTESYLESLKRNVISRLNERLRVVTAQENNTLIYR